MPPGQTSDPCATAYSAISNAAPTLVANISLSYVINGTTYNSNSCTGATSNMVQGSTVQITGSYPCVLAIVGQSSSNCTLRARVAEMVQ